MHIIAIAVIALLILAYFSFKSGGTAAPEPEIQDDAIEDSVTDATAADKHIKENVFNRRSFPTYHIVFDCGDNEPLEFQVPKQLYDEIEIGEQDVLVYSGKQFLGFGEHGAIADADANASIDSDGGFTYDGYDESIDREIDITEVGAETPAFDGDDRVDFERFMNRGRLPVKAETVSDEVDSFTDYTAQKLLDKTTVYPFLKQERDVKRMFVSTYNDALRDLNGYEGDSRTGVAADSVIINKNEIRVAITIQERPLPLRSSVTVEFGVNE